MDIDLKQVRNTVDGRDRLTDGEAETLEQFFQVLASANRIRLIESLINEGECSVGDLAESAEMSQQATSNQLRTLEHRGIVSSRKDGVYRLYRLKNECVRALMDLAICILDDRGAFDR